MRDEAVRKEAEKALMRAAQAVAEEREACARLCEAFGSRPSLDIKLSQSAAGRILAREIRRREEGTHAAWPQSADAEASASWLEILAMWGLELSEDVREIFRTLDEAEIGGEG